MDMTGISINISSVAPGVPRIMVESLMESITLRLISSLGNIIAGSASPRARFQVLLKDGGQGGSLMTTI